MMAAQQPGNEEERLAALRSYRILDTLPEKTYDDVTSLASTICQTPIALITLVDEHRQWFKSRVGLSIQETTRDVAFCAHCILEPGLMEVCDALADERFAKNPLVTRDPKIRFYAGVPLRTQDGYALGTLCVLDRAPRMLTAEQRAGLEGLARLTVALLELRRLALERWK